MVKFHKIVLIMFFILMSTFVYADVSREDLRSIDDERIERELKTEYGRINFFDVDDNLKIDSRDYYIDEHTVAFRSENYKDEVRQIINRCDKQVIAEVTLNNVNWTELGYTKEDIRNESMGFILNIYKHDDFVTSRQRIFDEGEYYKTILVNHENKNNITFELSSFSSITVHTLTTFYQNADDSNLEIDFLSNVHFTDPEERDFDFWWETSVIASQGDAPSIIYRSDISYFIQPVTLFENDVKYDHAGRFETRAAIYTSGTFTAHYSSWEEYAIGIAIDTNPADNIGTTSARLNSYIDSRGNQPLFNDGSERNLADIQFMYRETGGIWQNTPILEDSIFRNPAYTITGLEPNTEYEFRAVIIIDGVSYESYRTRSFTTSATDDPLVETDPPTNIQDNSVQLNGYLDIGDQHDVDVWFSYREGTSGAFSKITASEQQMTADGSFNHQLSGLDECTTYQYRAGVDWNGNSYVDIAFTETFTTTGCPDPEGLYEGLVSYWKLDETTGTTFVDSHGTNDGTGSDARISGGTGKINAGADFTQGDDLIDINTHFNLNDGLTYNVWLKPLSISGTYSVVGQWQHQELHSNIQIHLNQVRGILADGDAIIFGAHTIQENEWIMATLVHTGSQGRFYVDGGLKGTAEVGTLDSSISDFWIGSRQGSSTTSDFFDGYIDEVAIYDRALSSSEIEQLYNNGEGLSYEQFATPIIDEPIFYIDTIASITYNSARIDTWFHAFGDAEFPFTFYYEYRVSDSQGEWQTTPAETQTIPLDPGFYYIKTITDLDSDTEYDVRMVLEYMVETISYTTKSEIQTFTTPETIPLVMQLIPTNLGDTSVTLRALIEDMSVYDTLELTFEYREIGGIWQVIDTQSVSTGGQYTQELTGLTPDTDYDSRVLVEYNAESFYTNVHQWSTLEEGQEPVPPPPSTTEFDEFFEMFGDHSFSVRFIIAMLMVIGFAYIGWHTTKTVIAGFFLAVIGLFLAVVLGLLDIWILLIIILLLMMPVIYKLLFSNGGA